MIERPLRAPDDLDAAVADDERRLVGRVCAATKLRDAQGADGDAVVEAMIELESSSRSSAVPFLAGISSSVTMTSIPSLRTMSGTRSGSVVKNSS